MGLNQKEFAEIIFSQNESVCMWERGVHMGDKWSQVVVELLDFLLDDDPYPTPIQRKHQSRIPRYQWPMLHKAIMKSRSTITRPGSGELALLELLCRWRDDWFNARAASGDIPENQCRLAV